MSLTTKRSIWRPYTQELTAPPPIELIRAEGAHLFSKSGQKIFDGISSWWLITHGHCQPLIVEAIQKQAARLDQVTFANFTHDPAEELAELLVQLTPKELTHVFFSDNGSTAVEAALKMALQACVQNGAPKKQKFLAFSSAYHGDTMGAMSVSAASQFNRPYKSNLFEIVRAEHPTRSNHSVEEYLRDFTHLLEHHHQNLAGVIIEPLIQGAGGMIVWPEEAVRKIAQLCRQWEVYLIFDEVMTGFGRTGKMFAMERLGVVPDIICLSKGLTGGALPLAVTLVQEKIYNAFLAPDRSQMFFHGHSFTGNPIACAAAVANVKLFEYSKFYSTFESLHIRNAADLRGHQDIIDVRICGTMAALEVNVAEAGYLSDFALRVAQSALQEGLYLRPLGNVVYLLPTYASTETDLETAWQIMKWAIRKNLLA